MKSLKEIARANKPVKQYLRSFLERYEELFLSIRHDKLTVLEIGVGGYKNPDKGGGSLRMWAEFFPNSTIIGVDLHHKELELPDNALFYQGSQIDVEFLNKLAKSFDIVIDDASRITANTIITFETLWPLTKQFYIVEDLHMKSSKGTTEYFKNIPGVDFDTKNLCVIKRKL